MKEGKGECENMIIGGWGNGKEGRHPIPEIGKSYFQSEMLPP